MHAIKTRILLCLYFAGHALLALLWTDPGLRIVRLDKADDEARKRFMANRSTRVGDQS